MLDDYLKKLENIITPQTYSKQNYKNKFSIENNDVDHSENNQKLIEDYISKMGINSNKNSLADSRLRVYNKMLESDERFQSSPEDLNNTRNAISPMMRSVSPSHDKQRIHQLNIKNMNYRHEIESLKTNLNTVTQQLEEYKILVSKLEKQKDNDNKYLLKLENMIENSNKGHSALSIRSYSNNSLSDVSKVSKKNSASNEYFNVEYKNNTVIIEDKFSDNTISISDKEELKIYFLNILTENRRLKEFQSQVYEISKYYDDINSNMLEPIKSLQMSLNSDVRSKFEYNGKLDLINNFDKILETIEKTLEVKNIEYNLLIDSKDAEISLLNNELNDSNSAISNIRKDRIRDQKIINELEIEVEFLKNQISESRQNKPNLINLIQQEAMIAEKMEKRVLPAKQSVQKTIKKIEKTFDLQDKNNIKLLTNINKKLK